MNIKSYRGQYSVSFMSISEMVENVKDLTAVYVIIDKNVSDRYGTRLKDILGKNVHFFDANENNKTIDGAKVIIEDMVQLESKKATSIIAIGGGITQDISCFIASILYRGINWYFVPTTLLAQTDSCIGSKSSLNLIPYKNVLGTFFPPKKIFICAEFLETLSDKEYNSGLGEIVKCALLEGKATFDALANNIDSVINRDYKNLQTEIKRTLNYKKELIEIDEFDNDIRNLLNFGHTFGHAMESVSEYKIPHGQAVSIGLLIANDISLQRGYISQEFNFSINNVIVKIISKNLLDEKYFDHEKILFSMKKDKKYSTTHNCILLEQNGANKHPVQNLEIKSALRNVYKILTNLDPNI